MSKIFIDTDIIRNESMKLAKKILESDFIPDVCLVLLRGGGLIGMVIHEYFTEKMPDKKFLFAASITSSYDGFQQGDIRLLGHTHDFLLFRDKKILVIDDIFDSGNTLQKVTEDLISAGNEKKNIRIAVLHYKVRSYLKTKFNHIPSYYWKKIDIKSEKEDFWIHYKSHEMHGLSDSDKKDQYWSQFNDLEDVL